MLDVCTQTHPLKGCGSVWRPAGDADRKMETQPQDTTWTTTTTTTTTTTATTTTTGIPLLSLARYVMHEGMDQSGLSCMKGSCMKGCHA